MKTTFKKAFSEFEDDLMNTEENMYDIEVNVQKVKYEVFSRIENKKNKKYSKRVTAFLVAAVILLIGTVGAFAINDIKAVFQGFFNKGSNMNSLGLYNGGDVKVNSYDDDYNVEVLGVTGDGEKMFSAIQITKKDGSEVIDKNYQHFSSTTKHDFSVFVTTKDSKLIKAYSNARFELSNNNKVLKIYFYSFDIKEDVSQGKINIKGSYVGAFKIDRELASLDLPNSLNEVDEAPDGKYWFDETFLEEKRNEFGFSEEECFYFDNDSKRIYCQGSFKEFKLPIDISFDIDYSTQNHTEVNFDEKTARCVAENSAENVKMTITPFGVRLSCQFDGNSVDRADTEVRCLKINKDDKTSKIVLDDGTTYYLYSISKSEQEIDNKGIVTENYSLYMNTVPGIHYHMKFIAIDPREVKEVYFNGQLIYSK